MKKPLSKKCLHCGKVFFKKQNCSNKSWKDTVKFCSKECCNTGRNFDKLVDRMTNNNPAKKEKNRERMRVKNPMSHGGEVAYKRNDYKAVHTWVSRMFGTDNKKCDQCETVDYRPRMIHWANISGKYLRDREDGTRLCYKCHKKFDFENNKLK